MEKGGKATMRCTVTVKGTLTDCHIISVDPPNWDFETQTLKLAKLFKMKPQLVNGKPVEAIVNIPIRWQLGD